jgi:DNA-binding XRE family transcriptional regulator
MENKIKELRKIKRLSQDQLAEHLEVRVDELFLFRNRT